MLISHLVDDMQPLHMDCSCKFHFFYEALENSLPQTTSVDLGIIMQTMWKKLAIRRM